jgi:hypothetical protein
MSPFSLKGFAVLRAHQVLALLTLIGWLFAIGHICVPYCGAADGGVRHAAAGHHDDHGGDAPEQDGHHHHDLRAATAAQFTKSSEQQLLAPQWVPIYDRLVAELAALLRRTDALHERSTLGDLPPDTRMSGWLFVVQTARPVRGPSLAA